MQEKYDLFDAAIDAEQQQKYEWKVSWTCGVRTVSARYPLDKRMEALDLARRKNGPVLKILKEGRNDADE